VSYDPHTKLDVYCCTGAPAPLIQGDLATAAATRQAGIASPELAAFVERPRAAASSP
jgi:hypothetical protein